ncbi:MAG TPA: hypothetical protein VES19_15250 [Candidatus Limnocylindrales bacterium]|nr:hypothetical protein [Candidatus Limnocylindrales bacterium]
MSPAAKRTPRPAPAKPWRRAEAGRYRSADERFTLASGGGGWFVTDDATLDELGLARTTGPFSTLDAAKAAADATREAPTRASPLATRIAEAASRPKAESPAAARPGKRAEPGPPPTPEPALGAEPRPEPAPPPRTWLDDLEDADRDAAVRARRLIAALEHEGVTDAEAVVRRDILGGTPAIATRLLARAIRAAIDSLQDPSAADLTNVAEAVVAAVASSPKRAGLPGWDLTERDGPTGERRSLRVGADDLRTATEHSTENASEPATERSIRE